MKASEILELYASTTLNNGSDSQRSLKQDQIIQFTPPELDENEKTQKELWRIHANYTIKREELLEAQLDSVYAMVLSICEPVLKD